MAVWKIEPTWKKSIIEYQTMSKGKDTITVEIGWRWGEFMIETDGEDPPDIEEGDDIFEYDCDDWSTTDGCWEEIHYDKVSKKTKTWLDEFLEENSYHDLIEHDWEYTDCKMIINCEPEITREK